MRILIVEDDEILGDGLTVGLAMNGFTPDLAVSAAEADAALLAGGFSAVALDVMLPDGSGHDLLRLMRRRGDATPVLMLTALDGVADRIQGLDGGAVVLRAEDRAARHEHVRARVRDLLRGAGLDAAVHLEPHVLVRRLDHPDPAHPGS